MNDVFEDFVYGALKEALRPRVPSHYTWRRGKSLPLDEAGVVRAMPDLSLWSHGAVRFVGDAKYKSTDSGVAADIYQLLAYCVSTGLRHGMLIYAHQPDGDVSHQVVRGGPRLTVTSLDIELPTAQLRFELGRLADQVAAIATAAEPGPDRSSVAA